MKHPLLCLMLITPLGCAAQNTNAAQIPAVVAPAVAALAATPTALMPDAEMKARKAKWSNGGAPNPALKKIINNADKALKVEPLSVMEKKVAPPSGDKHDYMSVGPYWWPDPSKSNGLPWIRKDGKVNPATRSTDVTDYPSLQTVSNAVQNLAQAYYYTGDEKYAAHAAQLLKVWFLDPATKMNPNLKYGQAVPGANDGRPFGIIETLNWQGMVQYVPLLDGSQAWTPQDKKALQQWFGDYANWLLTSDIGKAEGNTSNNHSSWYDVQVARFALFADQPAIARKVLENAGERRIATQIAPDGSQPHELARTKSWSYSTMNLNALFTVARIAETQGIDLWHYKTKDGRSLQAALDYLAPYADSNVKWPHEQIAHLDRGNLEPLLREGARVYGDERYKTLLAMLEEK